MKQPQYKSFSASIAAGSDLVINRASDFVACLKATGRFRIQIGDAPITDFQQGLSFSPEESFKTVRIENPNQTELQVELGFGRGGVSDSRLTLPDDLSVGPTLGSSCHEWQVIIEPGWRGVIATSNADRYHLSVSNIGLGTVWLGGENCAFGVGLPIASGAVAGIPTRSQVYAQNPTSKTITLALMEIEK